MTTTNYVGRTIDLFVATGADFTGVDAPIVYGFGDRCNVITGVQKLVQRWMYVFFTRKGTVLGDDELGTDFLAEVQNGNVRDEASFKASFNAAARTTGEYLANTVTDDTPSDERLVDAELTGLTLIPGLNRMFVKLTTKAGTQLQIVTPLPLAFK